jgi:hypothetical protein
MTIKYNHVESQKKEGAYYTPALFADFISDNIIKQANLQKYVKILDPAVGDGELLISLIEKLYQNNIIDIEVYGFDINPQSIEITKKRLKKLYPELYIKLYVKDFLEYSFHQKLNYNSLFADETIDDIPKFDLIISNPPYIRTQTLGEKTSQLLSQQFNLKGKIDTYQAFLVAMKIVLSKNGIIGTIVSNRFLTTKGSSTFREILYREYNIENIWDFGDTKVFDAMVLPVVLILSSASKTKKSKTFFSSIYLSSTPYKKNIPKVNNQIEALNYSGKVINDNNTYQVKHGYLAFGESASNVWRFENEISEKWLDIVKKNSYALFKDIGKIRVGIKTTADKVFIRSDWKLDIGYSPELLRSLATHHIAGRFKSKKLKAKSVLYPHTVIDNKRTTINLDKYPLSKKYLETHRKQLEGRNYIQKANREWFEIWVPQNPSLWEKPKIIFRDISEKPMFWMDKDSHIVNGDCYWLIYENQNFSEDILWLALAIANSSFIESFYDIKFQNKLYSNRRRYITQYVEEFPLLDPKSSISKKLILLSKECYNEINETISIKIEEKINQLVWKGFGVSKPMD